MFRTEITVSNLAAITAYKALKAEYADIVKHGTTSTGEELSEAEFEALGQFIEALGEADRIVILQPGEEVE
jgi:hypothetical protein